MSAFKRRVCPKCGTPVIPRSDGECPSCRQVSSLEEYLDEQSANSVAGETVADEPRSDRPVVRTWRIVVYAAIFCTTAYNLVYFLLWPESYVSLFKFEPAYVFITLTIMDIVFHPLVVIAFVCHMVFRYGYPTTKTEWLKSVLIVVGGTVVLLILVAAGFGALNAFFRSIS